MTSGKLTIVLAMALVFGQLQCAAWCTANTCGFTELSGAGSQNVPPCHRHHGDSSKHSPAAPCSHGPAIASAADFSAAQAPVAAPLVAILSIQLEANPRFPIAGNEPAVLTSSPPGSGGPSSIVLRI
jgi:hypothetical protein